MRSFDFFPLIDDSASAPKADITENGRKLAAAGRLTEAEVREIVGEEENHVH